MSTVCTRFPCDLAYKRGTHTGDEPHHTYWGQSDEKNEGRPVWEVLSVAEDGAMDWMVRLVVRGATVDLTTEQSAYLVEKLGVAMAHANKSTQDAMYRDLLREWAKESHE